MSVKLNELTKKSKWEIIKEVPFYPVTKQRWSDTVEAVDGTLPIGTQFVVPDKRQTVEAYGNRQVDKVTKEWIYDWYKSGIYFDVIRSGQSGIVFFSDIADSIKLLEQPKDLSWYIRDTENGEFFHSLERNIAINNKKTTKEVKVTKYTTQCWSNSRQMYIDVVDHFSALLIYSKTVGSSKKFKNIGLAKNKILSLMGYYNDTDSMMATSFSLLEVPKTWEIVEYDKSTGITTAVDFDIEEYVKHAFELKGLTTKYGSATRELYKKLEKKDQIKDYKYFLIFTAGDVTVKNYSEYLNYYNDNPLLELQEQITMDVGCTYKIIDSEVQEVKALVGKDMKKCFNADSIAIAVTDKIEALELGFTYYGNLNYIVVDMETLTQVVKE